MLRTVLAVALAAALLAVSLPAVDSARETHAETRVETAVSRLETAASELARASDPVPLGSPGARRHHTLRLPQATWGSAGFDALRLPPPESNSQPTWRVAGGNWTVVETIPALVGPPGGLTLREGGRQRVVLTLHEVDGSQVVVVSRP